MAENSKIEWTDHTVNLWWGCAKVHTGCKNCYAEYLSDTRYKKELWGEKQPRKRIKSAFSDLDKYQQQAERENKSVKIFCGSMMDIFEFSKFLENITHQFIQTMHLRVELFKRISEGKYNNLIFLFLTKRPENIDFMVPINWHSNKPKNVWFGASISDQETAKKLIPDLQNTGFDNLFLSAEPQVERIEIFDLLMQKKIKWVIQGGESGNKKRPFEIDWAYDLYSQCQTAKVPYFFKQIDKIQEIPKELMIREFPLMICGK